MTMLARFRFGTPLLLAATLGGCVVGPNYQRPPAPVSATFKEAQGWKPSEPADGIDRGAWWSIFNDPVLDQLERRVAISNQNVAVAEANYRQAVALVSQSQAQFFPVVTGNASATEARRPGAGPAGGSSTAASYSAAVGASWAIDVWGKIRRTVEQNRANAEAFGADIANAKLSYQTQLAVDYFSLRVIDAQKALLATTVENYQRALDLATNQYNAGVAARADVITAQTQLQNAQAQAVDLGVTRAQFEHAIAILTGVTPADLAIAVAPPPKTAPVVPVNVASTLLERRPDIAAAERAMAAANAGIGVATAAYYPNLTLSGQFGFTSSSLSNLFSVSNEIWSIGPQLAGTIFDFGARKAQVEGARAVYDARVAQYRQTVLSAFQSVEDQIAAARVLEQEAGLRAAAEASARQAEALALNRYRAGQVDYATVVTAQNTALQSEVNSLVTLRARLTASVSLIEALGGGWTTADLPKG
ncbi:MAG TPA: efflux transporter outer membrane subunit [Caulobacteraceae bacterium]|jgi:NodT family efflux transporter outer membrane factor (OMF) lipoprotein|nr:efflux transporter outer membrane subunit [Caulobacteraceae bacterium]